MLSDINKMFSSMNGTQKVSITETACGHMCPVMFDLADNGGAKDDR